MDDFAALASWIEQAAIDTQDLVDGEFARVGTPAPGSSLDQCGLRDGLAIVRDLLRRGEYGVAFDHLLYMVTELDLALPAETHDLVLRAGKQMRYPSSAWAGIKRTAAG
jgi:hypothetical protein